MSSEIGKVIGSSLGTLGGIKQAIRRPINIVITILIFVGVLNLIGVIALMIEVDSLRKKTVEALGEADIVMEGLKNNQEYARPGWIDTSFIDVQPIGLGFLIVDFDTESVDGGVRVTGNIINSTTLNYYNARFDIIFDEHRSAEFVVGTLLMGRDAPFDVVVPPAGNDFVPDKVKIKFMGAEVSYIESSWRKK